MRWPLPTGSVFPPDSFQRSGDGLASAGPVLWVQGYKSGVLRLMGVEAGRHLSASGEKEVLAATGLTTNLGSREWEGWDERKANIKDAGPTFSRAHLHPIVN